MRERIRLPALCAVPLLIACATPGSAIEENERKRAIVHELFDAISAADTERLDELYADDFEVWTPGAMPFSGTSKKAQALKGMGMIAGMFPEGLRFTVLETTVEGDRVAAEVVSDGIHVSGKRYANKYHFLVIVRDGRVHRLKEYMDTQHAQEVLVDSMAGGAAP